jgi:hypothetical protein
MQPYFFPYAGYFRLFAAVDTFVIFDDVQFPRRGRVHRCQIPGPRGGLEWLTLPLARQPLDTMISELAFAAGARDVFDRRLMRPRCLADAQGPWADRMRAYLHGPLVDVVAFLEAGLRLVADALDVHPRMVRSSSFALGPDVRGQERVIALVQALNGRTYVNAPGGRGLYQDEAFDRSGLELKFLAPYAGDRISILPALVRGARQTLRSEVFRQTQFIDS